MRNILTEKKSQCNYIPKLELAVENVEGHQNLIKKDQCNTIMNFNNKLLSPSLR